MVLAVTEIFNVPLAPTLYPLALEEKPLLSSALEKMLFLRYFR
jgi:hypothetical protein